jgi:hypothetical protein
MTISVHATYFNANAKLAIQLAFLTPPFLGYFFANPASVTPRNGDILQFYGCMMVNLLCTEIVSLFWNIAFHIVIIVYEQLQYPKNGGVRKPG